MRISRSPTPALVAKSTGRNLGVLLVATIVVRLAFAAALPHRFYSIDIHIWEKVSSILMSGENPYQTTPLLYYPPLWMQVLFVLGNISSLTHISLAHLIQVTLTAVDAAIVVCVYQLLRTLGIAERRAFWIAMVGVAINPISIFMAIEHGNFDAMVGLSALGTAFALVVWSRGGSQSTWLLAFMSTGLGILAKTIPLVLAPMLLVRWRATDWAARVVGLALLLVPAAVGVSVLYALSPNEVAADIFQYRSTGGYFGVSGLLNIAGGAAATRGYSQVFTVVAIVVFAGAALMVARARTLDERRIILATVLLLMWIPALGSGYGPQYIGWILPLLVVLFAISTGPLRISLWVFAGVALATYTFEYAVIPLQDQAVRDQLSPAPAQTLFRLPLFFAYLGVLTAGLATLTGRLGAGFSRTEPAQNNPSDAAMRLEC